MGIESVTREELLREIVRLVEKPPVPESWFTTADIVNATGMSRKVVVAKLSKQVAQGVLGTERIGIYRYYFKLENGNGTI